RVELAARAIEEKQQHIFRFGGAARFGGRDVIESEPQERDSSRLEKVAAREAVAEFLWGSENAEHGSSPKLGRCLSLTSEGTMQNRKYMFNSPDISGRILAFHGDAYDVRHSALDRIRLPAGDGDRRAQ